MKTRLHFNAALCANDEIFSLVFVPHPLLLNSVFWELTFQRLLDEPFHLQQMLFSLINARKDNADIPSPRARTLSSPPSHRERGTGSTLLGTFILAVGWIRGGTDGDVRTPRGLTNNMFISIKCNYSEGAVPSSAHNVHIVLPVFGSSSFYCSTIVCSLLPAGLSMFSVYQHF